MAHKCSECGEVVDRAWCFGCGHAIGAPQRAAPARRPAVVAAVVAALLGGGVAVVATTAQAESQPAPAYAPR